MINAEAANLTLMVSDLDRSLSFYRDRLGFQLLYGASPHFWMLELNGFLLGLHPGLREAPGSSSALGLRVADIRREMAALEADGVAVPNGIVDDGGAILRADFKDPDGHFIHLVQMLQS